MADPLRKLSRARRDARRFAADARALAAGRRGRRLPADAREEIARACAAVEAAAGERDPGRLSAALHALDALWDRHLARVARPWRGYVEAVLAAVVLALAVRAAVVEPYRIPSGSMAPTLLPGDHVLVAKLAYGLRVPFTRARAFGTAEPRRGDVVVFESPREPGRDLVKRVVGVAGDVIELREQVLHVNGVPQPRSPEGEILYEERRGDEGAAFAATCRRYREALAIGPLPAAEGGDAAAREASWRTGAAAGIARYDVLQCRRTALASREGPYEVVAPGHLFVLGDNRDRSADSRAAGGWQVPLERVKGRAVLVFFSWGEGGRWPLAGGGPRFERLFKRVE